MESLQIDNVKDLILIFLCGQYWAKCEQLINIL